MLVKLRNFLVASMPLLCLYPLAGKAMEGGAEGSLGPDDDTPCYLPPSPHSEKVLLNCSGRVTSKEELRDWAKRLSNPPVTHLIMNTCTLGDEGVALVAAALGGSQVQELSLRNTGMGDQGATALASALGAHTSLTSLDIRG